MLTRNVNENTGKTYLNIVRPGKVRRQQRYQHVYVRRLTPSRFPYSSSELKESRRLSVSSWRISTAPRRS